MGAALLLEAIHVVAPPRVQDVLAGLGRTEDLCFSPDNRRLALAGFGRDRIFLVDVAFIDEPNGTITMAVTGVTEVAASELRQPHGLSFVDNDTLVVANRGGEVTVLPLPEAAAGAHAVRVRPIATIDAAVHRWASPGSVTVAPLTPDLHEVLVCDNEADTITRLVVDRGRGVQVVGTEVALAASLDLPDGVALSADRRWLAISNHNSQSVLLYRNVEGLGPRSRPDGILYDLAYPHGLRFTTDGRHLLVADAGAPSVHVFASDDGDWSGERLPAATHQVMDHDCFLRGRYNPQEGGPKGLDIDRKGRVLVVTSEHQPLAVFDLRDVLPDGRRPRPARGAASVTGEAVRTVLLRELARVDALGASVAEQSRRLAEQEDTLEAHRRAAAALASELAAVRSELDRTREAEHRQRALADDSARQLDALRQSTSWRLTAPARAVSERLQRLGRAARTVAPRP